MKRPIVICGPTASGKTKLSVSLSLLLNGEVVSADSMQIYRGMDIGTSKPTAEEQAAVRHHMIDVADPGDDFSAALYSEMASKCVDDILSRGKTPVICGGTGLYINALVSGVSFAKNGSDGTVRSELLKKADEIGGAELIKELAKVDPESAERIHPADIKRIVRALEVYYTTGKTITSFNEESKRIIPRYDPVFIGIMPSSREALYNRINRRVDEMISEGLIDEVDTLYKNGKLKGTAAQAIGYKELLGHIVNGDDLSEAVETIKRKTRNYAKRQISWFGSDDRITFIKYEENEEFDSILRKATFFLEERE